MTIPAPLWALFVPAQTAADTRRLNARAWAAEEAADLVLDLISSPTPLSAPVIAAKSAHASGNRAAKHRRRARLRHDILLPEAESQASPTPYEAVAARLELERIRTQISDRDWHLLTMAAEGKTHADIGFELDLTPGTVKTLLFKLRRRLAH